MITEPLFHADAYLAEAAARVVAVEPGEDGGTAVILDRTVFYPTGGGQPGDQGRLAWEGGAAAVATAVKGEAGAVRHLLAPGEAPPSVGAPVLAAIDWTERYGRMRVHTALHLLSVVLPFPVTGGAIGAERGRLDFAMAEPPADWEPVAARLNALVAADLVVGEEWISDAELAANPGLVKTMRVQPPTGQGRVRLVRIGEGAGTVDLQPCGGTHVRRTGEIGALRFGKIEKKGRENRRVTLLFA